MGRKPRGVRLDSGDLAADSIWVRQRLDETGWGDVEIFASGDLDEERIASLLDGRRAHGYVWRGHFALDFLATRRRWACSTSWWRWNAAAKCSRRPSSAPPR